jgi:hypothetical protein
VDLRIVDLDGSVTAQQGLTAHQPALAAAAEWGPRLRLACGFGRFKAFERFLADQLGAATETRPALTFFGSGDFHHVTLALLRRLPGRFNLMVLDKHPDWMGGLPFLHCGTWLAHACKLPGLQRVFHLGGDLDFDNWFRWLAPWSKLRSGKIMVFPAVRRFRGKPWDKVAHEPLRAEPATPFGPERIEELLWPYRAELASVPLYISLDKDVMGVEDAIVNWDSGHLCLAEVQAILPAARRFANFQLAGMDIVGDWSQVQVQGLFRRSLDVTEHPTLRVIPDEARQLNEQTNLSLLGQLLSRPREVERALKGPHERLPVPTPALE